MSIWGTCLPCSLADPQFLSCHKVVALNCSNLCHNGSDQVTGFVADVVDVKFLGGLEGEQPPDWQLGRQQITKRLISEDGICDHPEVDVLILHKNHKMS